MVPALLKHSLDLSPVRFCHNTRQAVDFIGELYWEGLGFKFLESLFAESKPPVLAITEKKIDKDVVVFRKTDEIETMFQFSQKVEELYRKMLVRSGALVVRAGSDLMSIENELVLSDSFGDLETLDENGLEKVSKSSSEDEREAMWNHRQWILPLVAVGLFDKLRENK